LLKWGLSCYLSTLESTSLLQDKQEDRNNGWDTVWLASTAVDPQNDLFISTILTDKKWHGWWSPLRYLWHNWCVAKAREWDEALSLAQPLVTNHTQVKPTKLSRQVSTGVLCKAESGHKLFCL
jgi:hypothetical protein